MKIFFLGFMFFFFFPELYAQNNLALHHLPNNDVKAKKTSYSSRLMLGVGFIKDLNYHGIKHLAGINANISLYQAFYVSVGTELYEDPRNQHGDQTCGIFIAPNLSLLENSKNIFVFIGGGLYLFHPIPVPESGVTLFTRGEYAISKKFLLGTEIKYVTRIQGLRHKYLTGNAYIAFRF